MLKYRIISAVVMLVLVLGLFWLDAWLAHVPLSGFWKTVFNDRPAPPPGLVLLGLMCVLVPLAARELSVVFQANGVFVRPWLISATAIAGLLTVFATPKSLTAPTGVAIVATVLTGVFVLTCIWHSRHHNVKGVVAAAGATMFAVAYLGMMGGFYLAIRRWHSVWVVLAILIITKMGDTGAYTVGRMIGRHKLIPWLSPGKTWEGFGGCVLFSVLFAMGFAWLSQTYPDLTTVYETSRYAAEPIKARSVQYSIPLAALAGVLLAIVGHAGDLMMSLFKRGAGLKDSGATVPGFGGVLDVLDSPLLVAPVAYWMLEWAVYR